MIKAGTTSKEGCDKVRLTIDQWCGIVTVSALVLGGMWALQERRFVVVEREQAALKQLQVELADKVAAKHLEFEIRLTKRESNAFTSQDANTLSNNVARLSLEIAQHEKALDTQQKVNDDLRKKLDELVTELREINWQKKS